MTTLLLVVVVSLGFYHGIRGSIPLAGTLSLELGGFFLLFWPSRWRRNPSKGPFLGEDFDWSVAYMHSWDANVPCAQRHKRRYQYFNSSMSLPLIVPLILLALTIPVLAIHRSSDSVFVAIFVLTAPYVGFLTTFFLDEIKPKARLTTLSVCSLLLPSVLLLVIWVMLGLDRLVVGSCDRWFVWPSQF